MNINCDLLNITGEKMQLRVPNILLIMSKTQWKFTLSTKTLTLPSLMTVLIFNADHVNFLSPSLLVSSSCHAIYNMISLTLVLSTFNPVQHSLLNVGKRISIVIALYFFSQRVLSPVNIVSAGLCLLVCVSGVRAVREQGEGRGASNTKYWAGVLVR